MKFLIIPFIKLYIKSSPKRFRGRCVFKPSCSVYSLAAFEKFGAIIGFYLMMKRLFRCEPKNRGDDILPETLPYQFPKWLTIFL